MWGKRWFLGCVRLDCELIVVILFVVDCFNFAKLVVYNCDLVEENFLE